MMVDPRTNAEALAGLFDTEMLLSDEFSRKKKKKAADPASLLFPEPLSPMEQANQKYGTGETILRRLGNLFTGGLFDSVIIPEISTENRAKYKTDMELYKAQQEKMAGLASLGQIMPFINEQIGYIQDDDQTNNAAALFALNQAGADNSLLEMMFPGMTPSADTDIMRTTKAYVDSHNKDNPDNPISFHEGYDIVKNYDAGRRGDQAGAVATAQSDVQQYTKSRDAYITAVEQDAVLGDRIANVDKGLQMLESGSVDTGPVVGYLANTFGMGSQELGELQQMSITEAMEALQMFKGPTTDFEFTKAELKSFAQIFTGEDLNIGTLKAARDSLEKVRKRNMLSGKSHLDAVREYGSNDQYNRLNSVFAQPEYWSGSREQATVNATQTPSNTPAPTQNPAGRAPMPAVGANVNGYIFKGGNPNDKNSWEKAQ